MIWRREAETASVFAVNGAYMEDAAGLGILSAMSAKMEPYGIYPVVNAQTLVYANYPGVADENKEMLMERYSQSMEGFSRMWSGRMWWLFSGKRAQPCPV